MSREYSDYNNVKVLARMLNLEYAQSDKPTERELKIVISYLAQQLYLEQDNKNKGNLAFNNAERVPLFRYDDTVDSCDLELRIVDCK